MERCCRISAQPSCCSGVGYTAASCRLGTCTMHAITLHPSLTVSSGSTVPTWLRVTEQGFSRMNGAPFWHQAALAVPQPRASAVIQEPFVTFSATPCRQLPNSR